MHVFADYELERTGKRCLHGGDVDLTVTLSRMPIADLEHCAFGLHWNVESRARYQIFVIHIAGVIPGGSAIEARGTVGTGKSHAAEERMQRNVYARREMA